MWDWFDLVDLLSGWGGVFTLGVICALGFVFLKGRELASGRCPTCGRRRITVEFPFTMVRHDVAGCPGGKGKATSSGDA